MIYIDIETATIPLEEETHDTQELWIKHCDRRFKEEHPDITYPELWDGYASLDPVFGKIICIAAADDHGAVMTWGWGRDSGSEKSMLIDFVKWLAECRVLEAACPCVAHNGMAFDFPYLASRYLANGTPNPREFRTLDKKPWELSLRDTMQMAGFTNAFKHKVGLDRLCHMLGVSSPKYGACNGSTVGTYWREGRDEEIARYCIDDVIAMRECYNILLK